MCELCYNIEIAKHENDDEFLRQSIERRDECIQHIFEINEQLSKIIDDKLLYTIIDNAIQLHIQHFVDD